jgi:alpha-ketoglutarate-dependent taurine dioxygenase
VDDLGMLAAAAARDGWAAGVGDVSSIRRQASALGWTEVPVRHGQPPVSHLRPTSEANAHPRSLSAAYGLGAQPLHTDGAHLPEPPDLLLLISESANATATRLWRHVAGSKHIAPPPNAMQHGMFLVSNGPESFFAPALTGSRYRYDPGCMTACDARARQVAQFFNDQLEHAVVHEWISGEQLLVVDNRSALHARAAVAPGDEERTLARVALRLDARS